MENTRTVTLFIDEEVMAANHIPNSAVQAAIGYLSMWSPATYPFLRVYHADDGDMVGLFTNCVDTDAPEYRRYVIGAVWSKEAQRYSFHS